MLSPLRPRKAVHCRPAVSFLEMDEPGTTALATPLLVTTLRTPDEGRLQDAQPGFSERRNAEDCEPTAIANRSQSAVRSSSWFAARGHFYLVKSGDTSTLC